MSTWVFFMTHFCKKNLIKFIHNSRFTNSPTSRLITHYLILFLIMIIIIPVFGYGDWRHIVMPGAISWCLAPYRDAWRKETCWWLLMCKMSCTCGFFVRKMVTWKPSEEGDSQWNYFQLINYFEKQSCLVVLLLYF